MLQISQSHHYLELTCILQTLLLKTLKIPLVLGDNIFVRLVDMSNMAIRSILLPKHSNKTLNYRNTKCSLPVIVKISCNGRLNG